MKIAFLKRLFENFIGAATVVCIAMIAFGLTHFWVLLVWMVILPALLMAFIGGTVYRDNPQD